MPLPHVLLRRLSGFLLPVLILAAAHFAVPLVSELPQSLAGLRTWGPLMVLMLACMLALAFNRGRVLFALLSLTAAYAAFGLQLLQMPHEFSSRTVFAAVCLFVPLNLATLSLLRERGVFTFYGMRRFGTIVLQGTLAAWVVSMQLTEITQWAYQPLFDGLSLPVSLVPQLALVLVLAGIVVTVGDALAHGSAIDAGFAGALVSFVMACEAITVPDHFAVYIAASGAILAAAVLQDTYRLAFRDELTGLPSRRALNERLLTLGHHFTIAMLDVDHFKQFNDAHGHELGDQVLRMVAAKLERVGGGGRAYRYGGEEFAVLFAGKSIRDVWTHAEALRSAVCAHGIVVRADDRPDRAPRALTRPESRRAEATVYVTVSIGIAERHGRSTTPAAVLRAADKALYRAKDKGRNRVSH